MRVSALALLLSTRAAAITIEIFTDAACTASLGNSSVYRGWAGICNTASAPDSGFSIGLDLCTPTRVSMSVFAAPNDGANEQWGGSFPCVAPADVTIDVVADTCTPVLPCSTCGTQYFKLVDTQCDAPAPVLMLQMDRGENSAAVLACNGPLAANAGQRFQTRELLGGVCNVRTITGTPPGTAPNTGDNCVTNPCTRLDINTLSMFAQENAAGEGWDIMVHSTFSDQPACTGDVFMSWPTIPEQDPGSLFCRNFAEWSMRGFQSIARHGLRVYAPQSYPTVRSASQSPSLSATASPTPSPTVTAGGSPSVSLSSTMSPTPTPSEGSSPSATPTPSSSSAPTPLESPSSSPSPLASTAGAVSSSSDRAALIGVSVTSVVVIAGLCGGLVFVFLKLRAVTLKQPAPRLAAWPEKQPAWVKVQASQVAGPSPPRAEVVELTNVMYGAPPKGLAHQEGKTL